MMNRPRDWYDMTHDQQRDWERREREREDLEYDLDRARQDSERLDRQRQESIRYLRGALDEERNSNAEYIDSLATERDEWKVEATAMRSFLKEKGLAEEFDNWLKEIENPGSD